MTYFCFIESEILSVPHMEPLAADRPEEALREAQELLEQHASGVAAHVLLGDERVGSIRRSRPAEMGLRQISPAAKTITTPLATKMAKSMAR